MDTIRLYNTATGKLNLANEISKKMCLINRDLALKLKNQLYNNENLYNENYAITLFLKYGDGKKRATIADLMQFSTIGDLVNYFATIGEIGSYKIESED